ncbi:MAG TPA: hypothetical protein ACQGQI_04945 [Xylella sp.]
MLSRRWPLQEYPQYRRLYRCIGYTPPSMIAHCTAANRHTPDILPKLLSILNDNSATTPAKRKNSLPGDRFTLLLASYRTA